MQCDNCAVFLTELVERGKLVKSPLMTEQSKPNIVAWNLGTGSVLKKSVPAVLEQLPTSSQHNSEEKMGLRWDISTLCEFRFLSHPLVRPLRWNYRHRVPQSRWSASLLITWKQRTAKSEDPMQVFKKKASIIYENIFSITIDKMADHSLY